jgi:hypothetical protein
MLGSIPFQICMKQLFRLLNIEQHYISSHQGKNLNNGSMRTIPQMGEEKESSMHLIECTQSLGIDPPGLSINLENKAWITSRVHMYGERDRGR